MAAHGHDADDRKHESRAPRPLRPATSSSEGSSAFRIASAGHERDALKRAAQQGRIQRLDRGLYVVDRDAFGPHHELAAIAFRRPSAVICLASAASFHGLTSDPPAAVQFGIARSTHAPRWRWPAIEPVTLDLDPTIGGITTHRLEGVDVRVTDPARTVAECLRHLDRIGMNQFQEILWSAWRRRVAAADDILAFADRFGIVDRMMPYLHTVQGA